ncbi:Uncharacterised protein [Scardovia inopinata]|nr:Uncharacterised protein [Scardovia inopinata]
MQITCFKTQLLHTLRILSEPLTQVNALALQVGKMLLQLSPSLGLCSIYWRINGHYGFPFPIAIVIAQPTAAALRSRLSHHHEPS